MPDTSLPFTLSSVSHEQGRHLFRQRLIPALSIDSTYMNLACVFVFFSSLQGTPIDPLVPARSVMYRFIAAWCPNLSIAIRFGGLALGVVLAGGGFMVPPPNQRKSCQSPASVAAAHMFALTLEQSTGQNGLEGSLPWRTLSKHCYLTSLGYGH